MDARDLRRQERLGQLAPPPTLITLIHLLNLLLQMIVEYNELSLIVHPVILNLIQLKWDLFGKKNAILLLAVNAIYTLIWTAIGVTLPMDHATSFYSPLKEKWWRLLLEVVGSSMTMVFIVQVRLCIHYQLRMVMVL